MPQVRNNTQGLTALDVRHLVHSIFGRFYDADREIARPNYINRFMVSEIGRGRGPA